jgi:hypothetical protein
VAVCLLLSSRIMSYYIDYMDQRVLVMVIFIMMITVFTLLMTLTFVNVLLVYSCYSL